MKTKYYVKFLTRAAHLDVDIELVEVIVTANSRRRLCSGNSEYIFDGVNPELHPLLACRARTPHSRSLAVSHLRSTLFSAYFKDIYEDVNIYLIDILAATARNGLDPSRLIGEHKFEVDANSILKAGSWNAVVDMISSSLFRKLENDRSTKKLLDKINTKLNLAVPQAAIDSALPYLEVRHLLVHQDGTADSAFCDAFPTFGAIPGRKLKLTKDVLSDARDVLGKLILEFDSRIISNNMVPNDEIQG